MGKRLYYYTAQTITVRASATALEARLRGSSTDRCVQKGALSRNQSPFHIG